MKESLNIKEQLGQYRRKFHQLELYRGLLIAFGIGLVSLTILALSEYFFYMTSTAKVVLLLVWLSVVGFFTWTLVLRPLLSVISGYKALTDREIAIRIGNGNPAIEDKILNFLELMGSDAIPPGYLERIIEQKTADLKNKDLFTSLNKEGVVRAAWIAGIPTALIMTYSAFDSQSMLEGSSRLFDYKTAYQPKAPFEFVTDGSWTVEKGRSITIEVLIEGESIPDRVFLVENDERIPMKALGNDVYEWSFDRVTNSTDIYFEALGFRSADYSITVKDVPSLQDFDVTIIPPSYTQRQPFEYTGSRDALIPEGSKVIWQMKWMSADEVALEFTEPEPASKEEGVWTFDKTIFESESYRVLGRNQNGTEFKTGSYVLNVLKDVRPSLTASWAQDSITGVVYINGRATDDYGVQSVFVTLQTKSGEEIRKEVEGNYLNFNLLLSSDPNVVSFTITAIDNDAIHGGKSVVLGPYKIQELNREQRLEELNSQSEQRVRNLEEFRRQQEDAEEMRERMNQRMIDGSSEWQRNQLRQQMLDQQQQLREQWKEMKESFERQNQERMLNDIENEELMEKRQQLQELLDSMNTDKLDELLEELEEEGENMNEDNLRDWMRRIEQQNERIEMDAERMEELMKRLNFEQNLDQFLRELEDLQQRQEELAKQDDDTQEQQEQLNEEFEELMNEMDSLQQENENLDRPMPMEFPKEKGQEAQESMEKSSDELGESKPEDANEQQQNSSQSMQEMMQEMSQSIMSMQAEMHIENLENLRRILTNLIHLSEEQEVLLDEEAAGQSAPDGVVVTWMKEQQDLLKGFDIVEDSLMALAGRVPQVEAAVTEWLTMARSEMEQANGEMSEREMPQANASMRESMLALNELALMIDLTMDQIQQMLSGSMPGNQSCEKPGGSKPSMSNMRARQQALSEMMKQMGQSPGSGEGQGREGEGSPEGDSRGEGEGNGRGTSQRLVEMMSRQAQIRQMLEESGSTGNNGKSELDELLEENERDIVRRNFDTEFWERQKEIEIKMLELEDAERLQEQDDQRQSETGDRYQELREQYLEEFLKQNRNTREEIRFDTPLLTPYYRDRSSAYLRTQ